MSPHKIPNSDGQGSPSIRGLPVAQLASPQPTIDPALAELSRPQPKGASRRTQGASTRRSSRNQPTYSPPAISPLDQIPGQQQPLSFRQYSPEPVNSPYERCLSFPPSSATVPNGTTNPNLRSSLPCRPTNNLTSQTGMDIPSPPAIRGNDDDSDGSPEVNGRGRERKVVDDDDADYNA